MEDFTTPDGRRPLPGTDNVSAYLKAAIMTTFSASIVLATESPAAVVTAGIYMDFMKAYNAHTSRKDVVTVVEKYASLCDSCLAEVMKVTESLVSRKATPARIEAIASQTLLTEKQDPWKLTGALRHNRLKAVEFMEERGKRTMFVVGNREGSDRKIVEALMARDCFTRQATLVVDWLESCAAHQRGMGDDNDKLQYFAGGSCAWTNTLHHVQSHNHIGSASSYHVTELDVGAPARQLVPMHEFHLFRSVYNLLWARGASDTKRSPTSCTEVVKTPLLTIGFLAHMALLLRQVGGETGTEAFSALLLNYIHMLIDDSHVSLVDRYAAALKATDHVTKYTQLAQPPN
ncbi:hypothetical protein MRX96_026753 [Rhipicephalus microplus]